MRKLLLCVVLALYFIGATVANSEKISLQSSVSDHELTILKRSVNEITLNNSISSYTQDASEFMYTNESSYCDLGNTRISVNELTQGIYQLIIKSNNQEKNYKLVIQ